MNRPLETQSTGPIRSTSTANAGPQRRPADQPADSAEEPGGAHVTLGLMAKYWTAGLVKTRLGASVGMAASATLHRRFTLHLCRNLRHVGSQRELCVAPDDRAAAISDELSQMKLNPAWNVVPQGEGDLGERMSRWMSRNLSAPATRAILIGADTPTLMPGQLASATRCLDDHDVVLGPAADGGYYLIGLRASWGDRLASLFDDVPWSSPEVFEITVRRAEAAGLSVARLPVGEDVDTIAELNRLANLLRESPDGPHRDLLEEIDEVLGARSDKPESMPGQRETHS